MATKQDLAPWHVNRRSSSGARYRATLCLLLRPGTARPRELYQRQAPHQQSGHTWRTESAAPCKRSEAERSALRQAATRLQEMLAAEGLAENEMIADFKRWRAGRRK
ncbi:MAG TPA: hypothetical protein VMT20_22930 [Terriglobia bacterium]|nr:hypothetical protein [Terriglobia bacterium]